MKGNQNLLLDIAMMYTHEISSRLSDHEKETIKESFNDYINGRIDYQKCSQIVREISGSSGPVDRIKEILEAPNEPLPVRVQVEDDGLRKKTQQWSKVEDIRLIAALHRYGADNWSLVATFVGNNRTRSQCSQRWFRGLDPRISRSHWSKEEEEKLLQLIEIYGDKSWIKVAGELGNRSDVQCRYHYLQLQKEKGKNISKVSISNRFTPLKNSQSAPSMPTQLPQNTSYQASYPSIILPSAQPPQRYQSVPNVPSQPIQNRKINDDITDITPVETHLDNVFDTNLFEDISNVKDTIPVNLDFSFNDSNSLYIDNLWPMFD